MTLSGKQKVLILVKTYPTPSRKYDELVCTAGITETGKWVRLYPIVFRALPYDKQYAKYDIVEVDILKRTKDFRPESYRPLGDPVIKDHLDTKNNWKQRKEWLTKVPIFTNLPELIAKSKKPNFLSLAHFKPTKIINFIWEKQEEQWEEKAAKQLELFDSNFKKVKKIPYKFKYIFEDDSGHRSKLMIEDWEIGRLYLKYANKGEDFACQKVKEQYFDNFVHNRDISFFLGTTLACHAVSKNPFLIIGIFYPPHTTIPEQLSLF